MKDSYKKGAIVWIQPGSNDRLQKFAGCWGQITAVNANSYTVIIGTNILRGIDSCHFSPTEGLNQEKAHEYLWEAMQLKFSNIDLRIVQYLITPSITNTQWLEEKDLPPAS